MSLFAVKYLPNHGWVGAKNFDSTFKPSLVLKKSFRNNIERLYVWDSKTKYTEGINEHGICIFSSNIQTKQDPKEAKKHLQKVAEKNIQPRRYYSPDGLRIRKALEATDVNQAIAILKEQQIVGCTVVFDSNICIILESGHTETDHSEQEYISTERILPQSFSEARCRNGVLFPWLGDESFSLESKKRVQLVNSNLMTASEPADVLAAISDKELFSSSKQYKTAYQALLVPEAKKIHVRGIWCDMGVNVNRLNNVGGVTTFEITCMNRLGFSEHIMMKQL